MTDRDYFAAAALSGMLDKSDSGNDLAARWPEMACGAAYRWADAMLRACEAQAEVQPICNRPVADSSPAAGRDEGAKTAYEMFRRYQESIEAWRRDFAAWQENTTVEKAGLDPVADRKSVTATYRAHESCCQSFGSASTTEFRAAVMNWISEATSLLQYRSDGGRRILADACQECWAAFERTEHDAAPAARARTDADRDRTDRGVFTTQ